MNDKHTPEPWVSEDSRVYFPKLAGGFSLHACPDAEANARRIVACVNACESIPTETLESKGMAIAIRSGMALWQWYCDKKAELEVVTKQRDDLLADIERCNRMLMSEPDTKGALFKAENILRAAIASVKESSHG